MLTEKIYEGKAKIIYKAPLKNTIYQYFKDDATAFNAIKKDNIPGKGILNNFISEFIMKKMSEHQIPNHFIERLDERTQHVKEVKIIPLEIIIRNTAAGSICKRLDIEEGREFQQPILEFCYKEDALGDPLINDDHAKLLAGINNDEVAEIKSTTLKVNQILQEIFLTANIKLIDFKIEFGKDHDGNILLADEISPDSCRLWDINTGEKMDKDRFRLDLGSLTEYYLEIANRLNIQIPKNYDKIN